MNALVEYTEALEYLEHGHPVGRVVVSV